jgi:hypothetical protein
MTASTPLAALPLAAKRVLVSQFTATTRRHLASLMEAETPGMVARRRVSEEGIEELAEMIVPGRSGTFGWWRRHAG